MRSKSILGIVVVVCVMAVANVASADTFDAGGANQFTIDFVNISGDASSANGTNISQYSPVDSEYITFTDPGDYRIGTYEITNDQWNKFKASYGTVTGSPSGGDWMDAYDENAYWTGTNIPTNMVSWYEGTQFVNYLNTSTGHQAAYKFTGTQGAGDYTFTPWDVTDTGYDASNPYRNSNAYYFLPTEDEWVKAAYWNGTSLQTWATTDDSIPTAGVDSNHDWVVGQPWDVGSGSEELNGTYDMMGNVWEWMESPFYSEDYISGRGKRGGAFSSASTTLILSDHVGDFAFDENNRTGFRVASVPEPCSLVLMSLGGLMLLRRRRVR